MNCSHIGKVNANNGYVGGVVGENRSFGANFAEVNRCFHVGGDVEGGKYTGGIIGMISGSSDKKINYNHCSNDKPNKMYGYDECDLNVSNGIKMLNDNSIIYDFLNQFNLSKLK